VRTATYTRYEVIRSYRNKRFFVFSLVFPLLLFCIFASAIGNTRVDGISYKLYYMTGMMAWGAMAAVMAGGARIAVERANGWTRQMRITPLSVGAYFRAKIVSGYAVAATSIVLISVAGLVFGVSISGGAWAKMIGLILIGLIPFAVLGILLGHLLTPDSMGPAMGGVTSLFALLGGLWFQLPGHGLLHQLGEGLPSYWLSQASKTAIGAGGWSAEAWIVLAVWTVVLARATVFVYRRDTNRA
jgi:ABC-2 type transport system permease protein